MSAMQNMVNASFHCKKMDILHQDLAHLKNLFAHADFNRKKFDRNVELGVEGKKKLVNDDEMKFIEKLVTISPFALVRENNSGLTLLETLIKVQDLDQTYNLNDIVDFHFQTFNILMKMMLGHLNGSLKTTKFVMRINHIGLGERASFFFEAESFETMDWSVLLNEVSKMFSYSTDASIDRCINDSFLVQMHVFEN